jgi:hypothetical protein
LHGAKTSQKIAHFLLAEEKALLARFAKAAGAGEMLNIHDLKRAYVPSHAVGLLAPVRQSLRQERRGRAQMPFSLGSDHPSAALPQGADQRIDLLAGE